MLKKVVSLAKGQFGKGVALGAVAGAAACVFLPTLFEMAKDAFPKMGHNTGGGQ